MTNEQVPDVQPETGAQAEAWRLNIATGSIFDQERALVCVLPAACVTGEWERRAHLITAAPDLLETAGKLQEALQRAIGNMTLAVRGLPVRDMTETIAEAGAAQEAYDAAIAKASGR